MNLTRELLMGKAEDKTRDGAAMAVIASVTDIYSDMDTLIVDERERHDREIARIKAHANSEVRALIDEYRNVTGIADDEESGTYDD